MAWTEPQTWLPGTQPGATELNREIRDNLRAILPVGTLIYRVANHTAVETVLENRFLECNGVAVSRTTYAALFNLFNSLTPALPFGIGNGSTTFNLPDLRGRVAASVGTHSLAGIGDNDGVAENLRTMHHRHNAGFEFWNSTSSAISVHGTGNQGFGRVGIGTGTPVDAPAHLFAGVYYVKYTS